MLIQKAVGKCPDRGNREKKSRVRRKAGTGIRNWI
jgi:hypothetical protein